MSRVGKIAAVFFFIIIFLLTLLVGTLKFEVLNSSFVFGSLQRNGVYEKLPEAFAKAFPNDPNLGVEEKEGFSQIARSISPKAAKNIIESNLASVIDFLNGGSKDINISISSEDLKIPGMGNIKWPSKNAPKDSLESIQLVQGIGNKILIAFIVFLAILALLYKFAGRAGILSAGIVSLILGGVLKLFLFVIASNTPMKEPSQVLLVLLSKSVLSDVAISWFLTGIALGVVWFILKRGLLTRLKK